MPGRARPARRRGSSTPSWPAGCWATPKVGLGPDRRGGARAHPGEGPLGRRLVDPAAARALAALRRARRRGPRRAARRARRPARRAGQARLGRGGVRGDRRRAAGRRPASTPGDGPRACTGYASAASSPSCARCGSAATSSPSGATSPPAGCCPTRRSSRPPWPARRTEEELVELPVWGGRSLRRQAATWLPAIAAAIALPEADLPDVKAPPRRATAGPQLGATATPPPRPGCPPPAPRWCAIADAARLPVENLLSPDTVRRRDVGPAEPVATRHDRGRPCARTAPAPWQVGADAAPIAPPCRAARRLGPESATPRSRPSRPRRVAGSPRSAAGTARKPACLANRPSPANVVDPRVARVALLGRRLLR